MTAPRPEAETEYSRIPPLRSGRGGPSGGPRGAPIRGSSNAVGLAVPAGGAVAAAALLTAEFTPLLQVHADRARGVIGTVATGSHDSYALVPVALLAALLAVTIWRTASRPALVATALLGVLVLLIALLRDLPDAQASGLIGSTATHFTIAGSSPSTGLYLETLGAMLLLITAAAGLLLETRELGPPGRPG